MSNRQDSEKSGWRAFGGFLLLTAALLALHQGSVLEIAYTPLSGLLALYLCFRFPRVYIAHVLFTFMFSAFIRRAAEGAAVREQSYILVAQLLVPLIGALRCFSDRSRLSRVGLVFAFPIMAIFYGVVVGLLHNSIRAVVIAALSWLAPVGFGLYLLLIQDSAEWLSRTFMKYYLILAFFVAIYAVVQFLAPFQWDVDWLAAMQYEGLAGSMGKPEPMGIRVFSTLSSPQLSGGVLGVALVACFTIKTKWKFVGIPVFVLALLVTLTRSAWLAAAIVMLVLFVRSSPMARVKSVFALILVVGVTAVAISSVGNADFSDMLQKRLLSFTKMTEETSYRDRAAGRAEAVRLSSKEPFGLGIGFEANASKLKFTPQDAGITTIALEVGYLGTAFCAFSILWVLVGPVRKGLQQDDAIAWAYSSGHLRHFSLGASSPNQRMSPSTRQAPPTVQW